MFPNGSEIKTAGTDQQNKDKLRGQEARIVIMDECGFMSNFQYVMDDILLPQTLTVDNPLLLLSSTPPESPAHPFTMQAMQAQVEGNYEHRTIYDNPLIAPEKIEQYARECGHGDLEVGFASTTWRREYLAQFVTDSESAVIPEFTEDRAKNLVMEVPWPEYFDAYVAHGS